MSSKNSFIISRIWQRFMAFFMTIAMIGTQATVLPTPVQAKTNAAPLAATNTLTLNVISARTEPRAFGGAGVVKGDPVTQYKYLINIDNTGDTVQRAPTGGCSPQNAGYPESCNWPSIGSNVDMSPIYTHGDQTDIAGGLDLPDGRYLISVLADGYKIDGEHFTVPLAGSGQVTVELQPNPLPDSTLKAFVFADNALTNGTQDIPAEPGLAGFVGHINDILGEVTTDVYGNPLCTVYQGEDPVTHIIPPGSLDGDGLPIPISGTGGRCVSDADGILTIPHLGSNRYTTYVIPPDGQTWIQTTTLEGNHDWDTWVMEGSTGFDTEFVLAGEPVPQPIFGFVQPTNHLGGGSGHIKGQVNAFKHYTPPIGGAFDPWGGHVGAKIADPIDRPWLSLGDLQAGDAAVWVGRGNADGSFDISGVPDGNYSLSWWDEPQNYNLNIINVTVSGGQVVDLGVLPLNGWWTSFSGYVFNDLNRNGVKDPGEAGVPNYTLSLRKRDNSLMDRGQTLVTTDLNGYYLFESAYPLGEWMIMEAYNDLYYTTGVTYQADNQPTPTTVLGAGVDVSVLNIIGLSGRMDWGVHFYDPTGANGIDPRNGGIVGTVSYDTTRNELDPQYAATEDWQPGISGLPVELWSTVYCGTNPGVPCDPTGQFELASDGSLARGKLLNTYVTESWERPTGCTARNVDGNPLIHGVDENVLATNQETVGTCIESFMQGVQFGPYPTDQGTPDANFGAAVDGNYGFGDGCFNGTLDATDPANPVCVGGTFDPLPADDYLVKVAIPNDASGTPMYQVTREEDINIGNGDQIIPQVPPPSCAGALHTVDVAGWGTDGYPALDLFGDGSVIVAASSPVDNATFVDIGASPFEGMPKPLCDTKLVSLNNGKSIVPIFNIFTDVPIPSRLRGLAVDDTFFSTDPRSTMYGEKAGIPFAPVGVYDFNNRLVTTLESDFNGVYDVLLPSTNHISCPTPSGVCANMYRFVANDPGVPGRLNPNWKPEYRTIATEFEAFPGLIIPTDLAPTQVGLRIEGPAGLLPAMCTLDAATPQLFAVSQPYVNGSGSFTITGLGFGAAAGQVTLDSTIVLPTTSWSDTLIGVTVPAGTATGPHQLKITAANGQSTVNGLTFHVRGAGYNPNLYEVGPGKPYATIQSAIDAAAASSGDDLVVVYPGTPDLGNPRGNPYGAYYENLIMYAPIKLQGVGPGGFQGNTFVPGSIIDAGAFGGDTALADAWFTKLGTLTWDGNQAVNDGEAIYVLASATGGSTATRAGSFGSGFKASIDGFDIRGGNQMGFPGNINDLTGGPTGLPPGIVTQGGAIFANAYARYLQITNNVVQNNGGGYGTVRIGTPDLPAPDTNQHNENIRIANNRIIKNAGTNLAGGIGLFAGADNYEVASNDLCGNYSTEYGGGLSVYGRSPNGKIHHNRIYFNQSNDEGGGIMIAGELPATPGALSPGSGPVDIYNNQIQANMANDDGGGIRFLMAGGPGGTDAMNVYNNFIVNNVSTHEGGGIGLNDAPNVRVYNNTIMKNLSTATAVTSNGQPAPAGLSTSANSDQLQATLPGGSSTFSNPLLFNNIFWDNRAGTRAGATVTGIGIAGDASPINYWDIGVADGTGVLAPTNSIIQQSAGSHPYTTSGTNSTSDPAVVSTYDVSVSFAVWAQNPAFVGATLVTLEAPPNLLGNYHLAACPGSPACNLGAASNGSVNAPAFDIDDQARPALGGFDSGADEFAAAAPPPPPPSSSQLYLTMTSNISLPGISGTVTNDDVVLWNGTNYSMVFDGSDVLSTTSRSVNGFAIVDANTILLSFSGSESTLNGISVDDSDIVQFTGTLGSATSGTFSMYFDGSDVSLTTAGESINGFDVLPNGDVIVSTVTGVSATGISGTTTGSDLFRCSGGTRGPNTSCTWSWFLDGSDVGLGVAPPVIGSAITEIVNGVAVASNGDIYLTTFGAFDVGTVSGNNRDVFVCGSPTTGSASACAYSSTLYFNGSAHGLTSNSNPIGGIDLPPVVTPPPPASAPTVSGVNATPNPTAGATSVTLTATATSTVALTAAEWFTGTDPGTGLATTMTISGTGPYSLSAAINVNTWTPGSYTLNVRAQNSGGWSALASTNLVVSAAPPTPAVNFYFSTSGSINPPGVTGPADNADIYNWNGTAFSRAVDVTAMPNGLPASANVDGLQWVDATHFYLSFSSTNTSVPGLGNVQDEDIVYYNNGVWSVYFDGTAHGLTSGAQDIDGFQIIGSTIYFSTLGNSNPPGVGGSADDADIYTWNGSSYSRVFDASTFGLPANANVRGIAWTNASNFYLTFAATNTTVPTLGSVQDEDVVRYNSGTWSVYFDGTAAGLTATGHDLDGFSFAP